MLSTCSVLVLCNNVVVPFSRAWPKVDAAVRRKRQTPRSKRRRRAAGAWCPSCCCSSPRVIVVDGLVGDGAAGDAPRPPRVRGVAATIARKRAENARLREEARRLKEDPDRDRGNRPPRARPDQAWREGLHHQGRSASETIRIRGLSRSRCPETAGRERSPSARFLDLGDQVAVAVRVCDRRPATRREPSEGPEARSRQRSRNR